MLLIRHRDDDRVTILRPFDCVNAAPASRRALRIECSARFGDSMQRFVVATQPLA
jgi:hypothetical protein